MASAATFTLSPGAGTFAPGEVFSAIIYVTPSTGEEITVAKLSVAFSANTLEVISFTQADGWMSPTSGQFDSLDNTAGVFEKMAGFPARVTTQKQFGTVTLKAKKAGAATLAVSGDSIILDTTNANKYVASAGANFTIVAPAPTPKPKPTVSTKPKVEKAPVVETTFVTTNDTSEEATTTTEVATTTATTTLQGQTAAVSETGGFFTTKTMIISLVLLLLIILGFFLWKRKTA